jgi:hypothetical protein
MDVKRYSNIRHCKTVSNKYLEHTDVKSSSKRSRWIFYLYILEIGWQGYKFYKLKERHQLTLASKSISTPAQVHVATAMQGPAGPRCSCNPHTSRPTQLWRSSSTPAGRGQPAPAARVLARAGSSRPGTGSSPAPCNSASACPSAKAQAAQDDAQKPIIGAPTQRASDHAGADETLVPHRPLKN